MYNRNSLSARWYRLRRRIDNARWAVIHRIHPKHRYNWVNTRLPPGYYDQDYRMLHANFALLCDYVEEEHRVLGDAALTPEENLQTRVNDMIADPDMNAPDGLMDHQINSETEALALYRWWTVERPANQERRDQWMMTLYSNRRIEHGPPNENGYCEMLPGGAHDESMGTQDEYWAFEQQLDDDDQNNLHRLINIRRSLWI